MVVDEIFGWNNFIYVFFYYYFPSIMQTCPCNEHPLTPHFYIVKLEFTRVYTIFFFLL